MQKPTPIDNIRAAFGEPGVDIAEAFIHIMMLADSTANRIRGKNLPEVFEVAAINSLVDETSKCISTLCAAIFEHEDDASRFIDLAREVTQERLAEDRSRLEAFKLLTEMVEAVQ